MLSGRVGLGAKPFVAALHSAEVSSARHPHAMLSPQPVSTLDRNQRHRFGAATVIPNAPGYWY